MNQNSDSQKFKISINFTCN